MKEAYLSFPVLLTLRTCAACLVLFLVIGLPLARWESRSRSFTARAVSFFVMLPMVFPPVALGFMLLLLLGKNGPIGALLYSLFGVRVAFSPAGVALGAFVAGLLMVVRPLQAAMERLDILRLEEAARTMGCGQIKTFFLITIPQTAHTLVTGLLLGLARALGEVGIAMMLGGNIAGRTNTLSLEIYNSVSRGEFDEAMRLCAILAAIGLVFYLLLEKYRVKEV